MQRTSVDLQRRSPSSEDDDRNVLESEKMISDSAKSGKLSNLEHEPSNCSLIDCKRKSESNTNRDSRCDDEDGDEEDSKILETSITHSADFFRWTHGHRRVMLTFSTICLFAFMTGVEYAVILPTASAYVKKMTPADIYVGLILSSYSISGSIAGVIMGKISDITGKVKILIVISNIFEVGGNILYFVTNNIHIVLLGRLIAGVGMGAVPPILADVAHRTTEKDRTKAISIILGCRQLGLLIGPCFTLLIRMMNFHIGSVHINQLNGPGFLMMCIWLILQIVCWLCFYDRTPTTTAGPSHSNDSPMHKYTRSDQSARSDQLKLTSKAYVDQYFRIEMFVLFLATFIAYFNQTALETIVSTFTEKHFGWNAVHTSMLFAAAGLEIIIVYLSLVLVLSKLFQDRFLLVFGFLSLTLACALGTFFTWSSYSFGWSGRSTDGIVDRRLFCMFVIFVVLDLLGLPFLAATSVSLFTKLTRKELQGFSQGIQRAIMGIGTIIGPIFASSLLNRLHIMMTTMLALTSLTLCALIFVMRRLRPLSERSPSNDITDANNNIEQVISVDEHRNLSELALSSRNAYVTLIQHEDEQLSDSKQKPCISIPNKGRTTNSPDSCGSRSSQKNHSFDKSLTKTLYQADEKSRIVKSNS